MALEYLKIRVHTLRQGLASRLKEYVSDFPTGTPKSVIDLLQQVLGKIENQINIAPDERTLSLICQTIQSYGRFLEYFDNAHTEQTPRALAQLLESLCKTLQPGAKLVVWPQAAYNYTIRDILPAIKRPLENLLSEDEQKNLFQNFTVSINLVSFPRIERDDILLHAIFGHELGHPIADNFLLGEKENFKEKYETCLAATQVKINTEVQKTPQGQIPIFALVEGQKLTNIVHHIRKRGLEELLSDVVSAYLFGPSSLFAMYDVLAMDNLDQSPNNQNAYPPTRYRLRLVKKILENEGYLNALQQIPDNNEFGFENQAIVDMLAMIDQIVAIQSDKTKIKSDFCSEIAYEWLENTIEDAIPYVKKMVKDTLYDKEKIAVEIPSLIERIAMGIPPNEINVYPDIKNVDWRSAILAAWLYKINGKKIGKTKPLELINSSDIDRLQSITMRAVEHILLYTKYKDFVSSGEEMST